MAAMTGSLSRSGIDSLGRRLAEGEADADDAATFEALLEEYDAALAKAAGILSTNGLDATGRLKTQDTTLDKVRSSSRLSSIQDIAGLRLVRDMTLGDQQHLARQIRRIFGGGRITYRGINPKNVDPTFERVTPPNHGYRAVHVVVEVSGKLVEIQIRTITQDLWAQIFEKLGDLWGRQIRYGGDAESPDSVAYGTSTRRDVVREMIEERSPLIAAFEERRQGSYELTMETERYRASLPPDDPAMPEVEILVARQVELDEEWVALDARLRGTLEDFKVRMALGD